MIIRNVTRDTLLQAAEDIGITVDIDSRGTRRNPRIYKVRLFPRGDHRRAVSPSGRRLNAVSWAGHRDFFRRLYRLDSGADIRTDWHVAVRYTSPEQFEETHEETGWVELRAGGERLYAKDNELE